MMADRKKIQIVINKLFTSLLWKRTYNRNFGMTTQLMNVNWNKNYVMSWKYVILNISFWLHNTICKQILFIKKLHDCIIKTLFPIYNLDLPHIQYLPMTMHSLLMRIQNSFQDNVLAAKGVSNLISALTIAYSLSESFYNKVEIISSSHFLLQHSN